MGLAQFDSRKKYFDGAGKEIQEATSLNQALHLSGMDFEVKKTPLYMNLGDKNFATDAYATYKQGEDGLPIQLGTVKKNYHILQNHEAFNFLDGLAKQGDIKFETAGTYANERKSFITCSTEPLKILGDEFDNYILLTNSFDGSSTVRITQTPTRVFCSNCISLCLKNANNVISVRHSNQVKMQMEQAKELLLNNTKYLEALKTEAEKLAVMPFSEDAFYTLAKSLYKADENASNIVQIRNLEAIESLMRAYRMEDLQGFNGTAWKAINAVSDYNTHKKATKKIKEADTQNLVTVVNGMELLNQAYQMILHHV